MNEIEDFSRVTKDELVRKLKGFMDRLKDHHGEFTDLMPIEFLEKLMEYPFSMCRDDMTLTLKELIADTYFEGIEKPLADAKYSKYSDPNIKPYYSFDDLAVLFDRSKASIHEAIKECEHLRFEIKKRCEEQALRAYERSRVIDLLQHKLGRYADLKEIEAYEQEQEIQKKDLENKEYAEFKEWKKTQLISNKQVTDETNEQR